MESPIVLEKPPEYHGNANSDRGFPFDEEEGSGAWSELAARHPDIAARLRQRPATWARKRRPSSQDATEDFGDDFGSFNRFPFDDIPPEFREHFPSRWNRRFSERDETQPQPQPAPAQPQSPQHQTAATQTEFHPETSEDQHTHLPQYGLRNTVDLGQKSPADPSLASDEDRGQRSMSAPPDNRAHNQSTANKMNGQNHEPGHSTQQEHQQSSHVRHIPIFVEGRDEPVINKTVDHGAHFGDTKPAYVPPPPPPQQPHIDREQYFDDGPATFHHPPNFSRSFGTPFNQGYRQGPQPFVQQKVYPQTAFTRGASPQRSQSPKPPQPHSEEHFVKVPVHHENTTAPSKPQPKQQPPAPQPKPAPHPQQPPPPQREASPQPKQPSPSNDPITQILSIQTDVLNLMTDVENFTGTKKDKRYIYLDEMLTRNLIKLDNIETDGKENIRQARKEAIRCIQKCIAVLEAKADNRGVAAPQTQDVEMKENNETEKQETEKPEGDKENGEVEMKEVTKEESNVEPQKQEDQPNAQPQEEKVEKKNEQPQVEKKTEQPQVEKETEPKPADNEEQKPVEAEKEVQETVAEDTRPEEKAPEPAVAKQDEKKSETNVEKQPTPKKGTKNVKKRDKSKDKKKDEPKETSNKDEKVDEKKEEAMQVDAKGDKDSQAMDVDCASASQ